MEVEKKNTGGEMILEEIVGQAEQAAPEEEGAAPAAEGEKPRRSGPYQAFLGAMDYDGDGRIDIQGVILMGLNLPGVRIGRESFLRRELGDHFPPETVDRAVRTDPLHANIPPEVIDSIADEVIKYERTCVSGISAALGLPGGAAMAATVPADIAQYYGYMLRATQKLMYLYGFPSIGLEEGEGGVDSETLNILIVCMGVMFGVAGANKALKAVAKALALGVEKQLLRTALTKGTLFPVVKKVARWFGVKMTKEVFAGFFKKAIPVVGSVVAGGLTFLSFKPCCDRLKASLQGTMLSDPDYTPATGDELYEIVESPDTQP